MPVERPTEDEVAREIFHNEQAKRIAAEELELQRTYANADDEKRGRKSKGGARKRGIKGRHGKHSQRKRAKRIIVYIEIPHWRWKEAENASA